MLQVNMTMDGKGTLTGDLSSKIVGVLAETLQRLQQALRPCCMSGREHYGFSLRHMIIAIQSLRIIDAQTRNQASFVAPFLKHELYRIAYDQIVREIDQYWFNDTINEIFRNVNRSLHLECLCILSLSDVQLGQERRGAPLLHLSTGRKKL